MSNENRKVVLVTGASSGIGQAIASTLVKMGYIVYGTSRKLNTVVNMGLSSIETQSFGVLKMIELDVCIEESVKCAVNTIIAEQGRIDILINNAGFGIAGSVEDTSTSEAIKQFDTNFFGVHRMCRNVIPIMRQKGSGLIINISSVAGLISIPFQSMYSASKYAVEALTEALRIEVKPFGIKVSLVEPGDTKTGFTDSRQFVAAAKEDSPYFNKFTKSLNSMIESEKKGPGPNSVVKAVVKIIESTHPPIRITAGISYKIIALLKRILPSRIVEYIVSRIY